MILKKRNIFIDLRNDINSRKNYLKALESIILNILIEIHLNSRLNPIKNKFRYLFNNNASISEAYKENRGYFICVSSSIESKSFRNSSNKNDRVNIYGFLIEYKSSF